jgi:ABC-type nitrate/sulfonate/bicarbonate transport system substrate-binding protein
MKRLLGILLFFVTGAVLVTALQAQERLTVLYPSPAGSWMIPVIAKEAKYFEKEGISLEYVRVFCSAAQHRLIVRPEIKDVKDLKGKPVGITTFGSTSDYILRFALQKYGLDPNKDVSIMQTGGQPEGLAAMTAGKIFAQRMGFPVSYQSAADGYARADRFFQARPGGKHRRHDYHSVVHRAAARDGAALHARLYPGHAPFQDRQGIREKSLRQVCAD